MRGASRRPDYDNDKESWSAYWKAQGVPWRTEPEIDEERIRYLTKCQTETGELTRARAYPFRDEDGSSIKLTRADIEWLLATNESDGEVGPVDWADERRRARTGVDMGGADLREVPLQGLPLAGSKLDGALLGAANLAGAHLEHVWLHEAQLSGARLDGAHLEQANLTEAHLERASFAEANLNHTMFIAAHMEGTELHAAHLEHAVLFQAHLEGSNLVGAHLEHAELIEAHLEGARLDRARLDDANLSSAHLEGAQLYETHLKGIFAQDVHLEGASLWGAHLEGAYLGKAHFEGKRVSVEDLERVRKWAMPHLNRYVEVLPAADLHGAFMDAGTSLAGATLGSHEFGFVSVADVRWGGTNLALVDWSQGRQSRAPWWLEFARRAKIPVASSMPASTLTAHGDGVVVGDERTAEQAKKADGTEKDSAIRLSEYRSAVRANRQLAVALREQGMSEIADHFAYRAQKLQREVLKREKSWGNWLVSCALAVLAGYGFRLWRILAAYGAVLIVFSVLYRLLGVHSLAHETGIQSLWDSFLVSLSAIHGRTMFEQLGAWTPAAWAAACESVVGIVIEGVFVAMLVQRFFAR